MMNLNLIILAKKHLNLLKKIRTQIMWKNIKMKKIMEIFKDGEIFNSKTKLINFLIKVL